VRARMRSWTGLGLATLSLLFVGMSAGPAAAGSGTTDPVEVAIDGVGIGQGGEWMNVDVSARCDSAYEVQDLVVDVSQDAGFLFGSVAGTFGLVCDDQWHMLTVQVPSSGDRWHGGATVVTALLDIVDPDTGDPVDQAVDTLQTNVREPAEVELLDRAHLKSSGAAVVRVKVRCEDPLVVQDLVVDLSQGSVGASRSGEFGVVCDGRWHRLKLRLRPSSGSFHAGSADALAFFTVLDPDSFDPFWQGQDSETLTLV